MIKVGKVTIDETDMIQYRGEDLRSSREFSPVMWELLSALDMDGYYTKLEAARAVEAWRERPVG